MTIGIVIAVQSVEPRRDNVDLSLEFALNGIDTVQLAENGVDLHLLLSASRRHPTSAGPL